MPQIQEPQSHPPAPAVVLFGCQEGMIRKLPGYKRHHFIPENHSDATQQFVRAVGHERVQSRADVLFQTIRSAFKLKRRQIDYSCSEGFAHIETPDFVAEIFVDQAPEDPTRYHEIAQVTRLKTDHIAEDSGFHACFGALCDTLRIDFPTGINVEDKIDAIEDIPELEKYLNYKSDASELELKIKDIDLHIVMDARSASFRLIGHSDLPTLLETTQKTLEALSAAGFPSGLRT